MSTTESLCPGYRQVESFGPDEEYEDEEVSYVTLDLGANVEPTLLASSSTYRLIVSQSFLIMLLLFCCQCMMCISDIARDWTRRRLLCNCPVRYLKDNMTRYSGLKSSSPRRKVPIHPRKITSGPRLYTIVIDGADRTKKVVVPVGTTEQRIRFKEVQLKRKSNEQQQQHPSADPLTFVHENLTSAGDATNMAAPSNIVVDRITGKSVPAPSARASRSKGKEKKEAKEKEKKTRKKTKGKGKEKETEPEPEATGQTQNKDDEDVTMENTDIPVVGEQADPDGGELMDVGDT